MADLIANPKQLKLEDVEPFEVFIEDRKQFFTIVDFLIDIDAKFEQPSFVDDFRLCTENSIVCDIIYNPIYHDQRSVFFRGFVHNAAPSLSFEEFCALYIDIELEEETEEESKTLDCSFIVNDSLLNPFNKP